MIINHPLLGPAATAQEFVYLGDASLIDRPDWQADDAASAVSRLSVSARQSGRAPIRSLWYHEQGDRSWLVVTRNTRDP